MIRILVVMLIAALVPIAYANDDYHDYARVLAAEPITVSDRVAVRKKVCKKPSAVSPPGDARRDRPKATIGDLIRSDSKQRLRQCHNVTKFEQREKNVGWRVTYEYAGTEYIRTMKEKPGERIRVRIDLETG